MYESATLIITMFKIIGGTRFITFGQVVCREEKFKIQTVVFNLK